MSQRVLVTAAASGIGREIARAFYQGGAAVFVCDVDTSALSELERELRGVRTAMCDVGESRRRRADDGGGRRRARRAGRAGEQRRHRRPDGYSGTVRSSSVGHGHAGQPDGHLRQSIKGLVDPRDVAALAVFLASDSAKAISGQILPIDNDRQQAS